LNYPNKTAKVPIAHPEAVTIADPSVGGGGDAKVE